MKKKKKVDSNDKIFEAIDRLFEDLIGLTKTHNKMIINLEKRIRLLEKNEQE